MLEFFYNCILFFYAACTLPKFLWQWCILGKYRETIKQRFGFELPSIKPEAGQKLLWIHAVSMGETRAVIPLYRRFRAQFPDLKIVISTTTETGHAEAKRSMPDADSHFFLPFDFSWIIRKFMRALQPSYLILVESDIWYNLIQCAKKQGAHVFLVNGKISERSARRFEKIPFFTKQLFSFFDLLCVQNTIYRDRFFSLDVPLSHLVVTGNIKLDVAPKRLSHDEAQALKGELGIEQQDRVLVIGSSHEPEEEWLLTALSSVWQQIPNLKVILVPRHPERFSRVASLLKDKQIDALIYSKREERRGGERVILIDAMGMLNSCYQIAHIAIVAGSFLTTVGGHNIFEPVVFGAPVFFGPHMHSQPDFPVLILKGEAGRQVTLQELPKALLELLQNEELRQRYIEAGQTLVQEVEGSIGRTFAQLLPYFQEGKNSFIPL